MSEMLEKLAEEVAEEQSAIDGQSETTRERVIRMGKLLAKMQKEQKKEQAETGQTWKDWVEEQKNRRAIFPSPTQTVHYVLVAKYPRAYAKGMSIKEAYKEAGKWKANGGNPPIKEKVAIQSRTLMTITAGAGKLAKKIDDLTEVTWEAKQEEEKWSEDEIAGALDQVTLLQQSCRYLIKQLKEAHAALPQDA
jgi:hypothetical protein